MILISLHAVIDLYTSAKSMMFLMFVYIIGRFQELCFTSPVILSSICLSVRPIMELAVDCNEEYRIRFFSSGWKLSHTC